MVHVFNNPTRTGRVLIAGCGDVGIELATRLHADGFQVTGIRRRPAGMPDFITPLQADLAQAESLPRLAQGFDYLVYLASADGYSEAAYRNAYMEGPRSLLEWIIGQGHVPRRMLFVSSTSVYSEEGGGWVDEDSPVRTGHFGPDSLLAGEQIAARSPIESVVVRFGGIYGPGRSALLDRVRAGTATCTLGAYTNRIHRDDCAGVLAHLLALDEVKRVYLAVDSDPAPACEVQTWLADRLDAPAPQVMQRNGRYNKRCSNQRLLATGYQFLYPSYRQGYEHLISQRD